MSLREQRLLEIETAMMRHNWAKAQVASGGATKALTLYVESSRVEMQDLHKRERHRKSNAKARNRQSST
jgi:hypothetical protein